MSLCLFRCDSLYLLFSRFVPSSNARRKRRKFSFWCHLFIHFAYPPSLSQHFWKEHFTEKCGKKSRGRMEIPFSWHNRRIFFLSELISLFSLWSAHFVRVRAFVCIYTEREHKSDENLWAKFFYDEKLPADGFTWIIFEVVLCLLSFRRELEWRRKKLKVYEQEINFYDW